MELSKKVSEYAASVKNYNALGSSVLCGPKNLTVKNDTLYFTQGIEQQLYYWKGALEGGTTKEKQSSESEALVPTPVFSCSDTKTNARRKLTNEEELLNERMRSIGTNISSYSIRESDGAIFIIIQSKLFIYYQNGPRAGKEPLDVFSFIDPTTPYFDHDSPCMEITFVHDSAESGHGNAVFVHKSNLYNAKITEQLQDESKPLVVEVTPITTIGDELHPCGIADYITQEEFSRYSGHYENENYIVFSYIDTSMTPIVSFLKGESGLESMPYPRVGDANSKTTIVVYDRRKKLMYYLPWNVIEKSTPFPVEYIPRFGFKDKDTIYLQVLDRHQERSITFSYPINALCEVTEAELQQVYSDNGMQAKENLAPLHVELEQCIPWAWTEILPREPVIFGKDFDITIRSDVESKTAHYHLYARPSGGNATSWKQLTTGEWNVARGFAMKCGDRVAFIANAGARLQRRLFYITIPSNLYEGFSPFNENEIIPICREGESVLSFTITENYAFYCSCTGNEIPSLHFVKLLRNTDSEVMSVVDVPTIPWVTNIATDEIATAKQGDPSSSKGQMQMTVCGGLPVSLPMTVTATNTRGVPISGSVFTPPSSAPSRATQDGPQKGGLPLVIYVYGGPHVQLVYENSFDKCFYPAIQTLIQEGFAVAVVDGQMSEANGLRALSICKKNMGNFETDDYVCFVHHLTTCPERMGLPSSFKVDPTRVAIYGWSYGGYATLLAISQAPKTFKMGFSGAPVGDWRLYDTGYTERYLGLLHDEESGNECSKAYTNSSIGHFVNGFPDEIDRLYIAHGLLDENVHFVNTSHITAALIEAGKPYSLLIFPDERHGLRQKPFSKSYYYGMLIKRLAEKL